MNEWRYENFKYALNRLIEALNFEEVNDIIIDGIIQRFELHLN